MALAVRVGQGDERAAVAIAQDPHQRCKPARAARDVPATAEATRESDAVNTYPAGSVYDMPLSTLDLLPTFVQAGGGDPTSIDGLDGVDMVPYLLGANKQRPHQTLYWKMETRGAIRDGDWKMLRFPDRPAELFNLTDDPGEQNSLAAAHPEKVTALFKKLFAWEMELERPLFLLRRAEESWSARRTDQFRKPPAASY